MKKAWKVEPLGPVSMREGPPYQYAATLIYKRDSDRLSIGNWGDLVERHPRLGESY